MKKERFDNRHRVLSLPALFIVLAAVIGAYLVTGCGSTDQTTSSASSGSPATSASAAVQPDACSLVTKAEVEAAVGTTVAEPKTKQTSSYMYCEWTTSDSQSKFSIAVPVLTSDAKKYFDEAKTGAGDTVDIPGLGDAAFSFSNEVWVLKNGKVFSFQGLLMPEDASTLAIGKALMQKAAAKA